MASSSRSAARADAMWPSPSKIFSSWGLPSLRSTAASCSAWAGRDVRVHRTVHDQELAGRFVRATECGARVPERLVVLLECGRATPGRLEPGWLCTQPGAN